VVGEIMGDFYPEVKEKSEFIQKVIKNEEERFHETLSEGLTILSKVIKEAKENKQTLISGKDVFRLYDTYGFPIDLTEEYVAEHGLDIDREGFEKEMEAQRTRAREARQLGDSMQVQNVLLGEIKNESKFVGYDTLETQATVEVIVKENELAEY